MCDLEEMDHAGFFAHCNTIYCDGDQIPAEVAIASIRDSKGYRAFTINLSNLRFDQTNLVINLYHSDTHTKIVLSQIARGSVPLFKANGHLYKMYNDMLVKRIEPREKIVYVYGPLQKELLKRYFRFLPVVDVLESPSFKTIPEPLECNVTFNGHRFFHDGESSSVCSLNKACGYAKLLKIKISKYDASSTESEEE
ncbi:hypothetical protein TNCT_543791 [Trichonephila clavata]|uniref:Uncharacterized protein n=1 Tax=Trichonephila clavata TaxID=2740835 RepID=A0A8X6I9K0_TRICU|nr:hypothetical protein TNCT_543791 [Trichonephila clavata]